MREINLKIKIGRGEYLEAKVIGDLRGTVKQQHGTEIPFFLTNVKYVPQLFCNLMSLTSVLTKGFKLTGNKIGISIQKLNRKYLFDQHIKSGDGELAGIQIDTLQPDITTICRRCMHAVLGHPSTETTNMTAKIFF